ncbi:MAG TPA: hypothetical protein VF103_06735, partial [Polyangiaceae bacterium]
MRRLVRCLLVSGSTACGLLAPLDPVNVGDDVDVDAGGGGDAGTAGAAGAGREPGTGGEAGRGGTAGTGGEAGGGGESGTGGEAGSVGVCGPLTVEWSRAFDGVEFDTANAIAADPIGNVYVTITTGMTRIDDRLI